MKCTEYIHHIIYSKTVKGIAAFIGFILVVVTVCALSFNSYCGSKQSDFKPIQYSNSKITPESFTSLGNYSRPVESTYLTFPEWYLVFNPQEYAKFISEQSPSSFPYLTSIRQFWGGYCEVYGITKHNYPFNKGDHLVEVVIGTSFSVEYTAKGIWENTIGRVSEWTSGGEQTEEDVYAAHVADEYGKFIPNYPWYAFDFAGSLRGLWSQTKFFGPHVVRKFERKLFLSIEYGVKALYAKVIGAGTHSVYGVADTEVYAVVRHVPPSIFEDANVRLIKDLGNGALLITVPHYQGFTDTIPGLSEKGVDFIEVAGNKEIAMSVIVPSDTSMKSNQGKILFSMEVVGDAQKKRIVMQVPIEYLGSIIRELSAQHISIEHLFDY